MAFAKYCPPNAIDHRSTQFSESKISDQVPLQRNLTPPLRRGLSIEFMECVQCQQHTKNMTFIHDEMKADAGRGVLHPLFPPASDLNKSVVRTTSGVVAGDSVAHSSRLNHKSTRTRDGNKNSPSCFDGCSVETLRQGILR